MPPATPIVTAPKVTLTTRHAGSLISNSAGKVRFPNSASSAANSTVIRSVYAVKRICRYLNARISSGTFAMTTKIQFGITPFVA